MAVKRSGVVLSVSGLAKYTQDLGIATKANEAFAKSGQKITAQSGHIATALNNLNTASAGLRNTATQLNTVGASLTNLSTIAGQGGKLAAVATGLGKLTAAGAGLSTTTKDIAQLATSLAQLAAIPQIGGKLAAVAVGVERLSTSLAGFNPAAVSGLTSALQALAGVGPIKIPKIPTGNIPSLGSTTTPGKTSTAILASISSTYGAISKGLGAALSGGVALFKTGVLSTLGNIGSAIGKPILTSLSSVANAAGNVISRIVQKLTFGLSSAISGGLGPILSGLGQVASGIGSALIAGVRGAASVISTVVSGIGSGISAVVGTIGTGIKGAFNGLIGIGSAVVSSIGTVVSGVTGTIGNIAGSVGSVFGQVFVVAAGNLIGTGISNALRLAVQGAINLVQAGLSGIQATIDVGIEYEQNLANIQADLTNLNPTLFEDGTFDPQIATQLSDTITGIALDPKLVVGFKEASQAAQTLTRYGYDVDQISNGALEATVLLQNATGSTYKLAGETLAKYAQLNDVAPENLVDAVSQITATISKGGFRDLNDYRYALVNAAGDLQNFGVNQADVNTLLAATNPLFASGRTDGTAFAAFMRNLTPTSQKAKDAMAELGLSFFDTNGQFIGIEKTIGDLRTVFGQLTEAQRSAYAETIFGVTGGKFLQAVLTETTDEQIRQTKAVILSANAYKSAAARTATLGSKLNNLGDAFKALGIKITNTDPSKGIGVVAALIPPVEALQGVLVALAPAAEQFGIRLGAAIAPGAQAFADFINDITAGAGNFNSSIGDLKVLRLNDLISFELGDFSATFDEAFAAIDLGFARFGRDQDRVVFTLGDFFTFDRSAERIVIDIADYISFGQSDGRTVFKIGDFFEFDKTSSRTRININDYIEFYGTDTGTIFKIGDILKFEKNDKKTQLNIGDFFEVATTDIAGEINLRAGTFQTTIDVPALQAKLEEIITPVVTFAQSIPEKLTAAFAFFQAGTQTDLTGVDSAAPSGIQAFITNIQTQVETAFANLTLPNIGQKLTDALALVLPADFSFENLFPTSASDALTRITSAFDTLAASLGLADTVLGELSAEGGGIAQMRDLVTGTISGVGEALAGIDAVQAQNVGASFSNAIISVLSVFTTLSDIGNANVEGIVGSLSTLTQGILNFATGFSKGLDAKGIGAGFAGLAKSFVDEFTLALTTLDLPAIGEAASGFVLAISGNLKDAFAPGNLTTVGASIGTFVTTLVDQVALTFSNPAFGQQLGTATANIAVALTQGLADLFTGFGDAVDDGAGQTTKLNDAGQTFVQNFVDAVSAGLESADYGALAGSLVTGIKNSVFGLFGFGEEAVAAQKQEVARAESTAQEAAQERKVFEERLAAQTTPITPEQNQQLAELKIEELLARTQASNESSQLLTQATPSTLLSPGEILKDITALLAGPAPDVADPNALARLTAANGAPVAVSQAEIAGATQQLIANIADLNQKISLTTDAQLQARLEADRSAQQVILTSLQAQSTGLAPTDAQGNVIIDLPGNGTLPVTVVDNAAPPVAAAPATQIAPTTQTVAATPASEPLVSDSFLTGVFNAVIAPFVNNAAAQAQQNTTVGGAPLLTVPSIVAPTSSDPVKVEVVQTPATITQVPSLAAGGDSERLSDIAPTFTTATIQTANIGTLTGAAPTDRAAEQAARNPVIPASSPLGNDRGRADLAAPAATVTSAASEFAATVKAFHLPNPAAALTTAVNSFVSKVSAFKLPVIPPFTWAQFITAFDPGSKVSQLNWADFISTTPVTQSPQTGGQSTGALTVQTASIQNATIQSATIGALAGAEAKAAPVTTVPTTPATSPQGTTIDLAIPATAVTTAANDFVATISAFQLPDLTPAITSAINLLIAKISAFSLPVIPAFSWSQFIKPFDPASMVLPLDWSDFIRVTQVSQPRQPGLRGTPQGFAKGTSSVPATGSYLVGEEGPEVVVLQKGSRVIPNHKLGDRLLGAYASGTTDPFDYFDRGAIERRKKAELALAAAVEERARTEALASERTKDDDASKNPIPATPVSGMGGASGAPPASAAGLNELNEATGNISDSVNDAASIIEDLKIANENLADNLKDVSQFLQGVPGLFGASPVTQEQLDAAAAGIPQEFADDFVRQLAAEVKNGNQEFGNLLPQAVAALEKIGVTPGANPAAILAQIQETFASGRLFANAENLSLINQEAVQKSVMEQQQAAQGQENIKSFFSALLGSGVTDLLGGSSEPKTERSSSGGEIGVRGDGGAIDPFPGWTGKGGLIPSFPGWTSKGGLIPTFPGWGKAAGQGGFIPDLDWSEFITELGGAAATPVAPTTEETEIAQRNSEIFSLFERMLEESEGKGSVLGVASDGGNLTPFPGWTGKDGLIPPFPEWTGKSGLVPVFPGWGKSSSQSGFIPDLDWADFVPELSGIGGVGTGSSKPSSATQAAQAAQDATDNALRNPQPPAPETDTEVVAEEVGKAFTNFFTDPNGVAGVATSSTRRTANSTVVATGKVADTAISGIGDVVDQAFLITNRALAITAAATEDTTRTAKNALAEQSSDKSEDSLGQIIGGPSTTPVLIPKFTSGPLTNAIRPAEQQIVNQPQTQVVYGAQKSQTVSNAMTKVYQLNVTTQQMQNSLIREFQTMQVLGAV